PVMPTGEVAVGIETGLEHVMGQWPRAGGGDVVLAREDELHRLLGDVGQNGRLDRGVRPDTPAVAAAPHLLVDLDLVRRGLEDAGDDVGGERAKLRAGPDFGRLAVF